MADVRAQLVKGRGGINVGRGRGGGAGAGAAAVKERGGGTLQGFALTG